MTDSVMHLLQMADVIACTTGHDEDVKWGSKFLKGRVAVAELADAAAAIVEYDTDSPAHNRVLAAIARVRGESA